MKKLPNAVQCTSGIQSVTSPTSRVPRWPASATRAALAATWRD